MDFEDQAPIKQTIFAQASAHGRAGVAIFRISGTQAKDALPYFGLSPDIEARKAHVTHLRDVETQTIIDQGVILYFAAPHSFTGEDVIELQVHGSIAVAKILLNKLATIPGFRLAEPGEFAKRAFFNHKMDLTMAEGLADLLEAETTMQHQQAIRQLGGELEKLYESWRKQLIDISALIEAFIDFPEDEIPEHVIKQASSIVDDLKSQWHKAAGESQRGERIRQGLALVIIGEPNVGKSSLGNYLAGREAAIVSDTPGTTRDIVESYIDIKGYPIVIRDTAGIRDYTDDKIEEVGMALALEAAKEADIKILMFDNNNVNKAHSILKDIIDERTIIVVNKSEFLDPDTEYSIGEFPMFKISVKERLALEQIVDRIGAIAESIIKPAEPIMTTRLRHKQQLLAALNHLQHCDLNGDLVLAAEDLRLAARELSLLTGKIAVDEILGKIFASFCIGK